MMDNWKIVWTDPEVAHVACVPTGDAVLEWVKRLHATERDVPPVVEIMKLPGEGPSLSIAVGHEETVLTFEETLDPPYYISLGETTRDGIGPLFIHGGQGVDHAARNLVAWDLGLEALLQFLTTGKRPCAIDWEQL
jgi:hypothetical protein